MASQPIVQVSPALHVAWQMSHVEQPPGQEKLVHEWPHIDSPQPQRPGFPHVGHPLLEDPLLDEVAPPSFPDEAPPAPVKKPEKSVWQAPASNAPNASTGARQVFIRSRSIPPVRSRADALRYDRFDRDRFDRARDAKAFLRGVSASARALIAAGHDLRPLSLLARC